MNRSLGVGEGVKVRTRSGRSRVIIESRDKFVGDIESLNIP